MRNWFFDYVFPVVFLIMLAGVLGSMGFGAYMTYECYRSNDPNSTACFMVTGNQQTINLNERVR